MGKFTKLHKNKKFSYSPRYYEGQGKVNPFKIEQKLSKFRNVMSQGDLKSRFSGAMADSQRKGDRYLTIRLFIITAILLFIFLFIIDFDLSIFFKR